MNRIAVCFFYACMIIWVVCPTPTEAKVVHVSKSGNNSNNGLTWANAKASVQAGLNAASSGDEVWVAAGTYNEDISLKSGVALYGGFNGTETSVIHRDWKKNETIIDASEKDNCVAFVPEGALNTTRIDGFTLTGGMGWKDWGNWRGGGIYAVDASVIIANNRIQDNSALIWGGGIFLYDSDAQVVNNILRDNVALRSDGGGGGIYVFGGNALIANNIIDSNRSTGGKGGGIAVNGAARIVNNTIIRNLSGASIEDYGAIWIRGGAPTIANNIIALNLGGIRREADAGNPVLSHNCFFHILPAYDTFGISPDPIGTNGNFRDDPLFLSVSNNDFAISAASPCADAGNNAHAEAGWRDMHNQPRIMNANVDIGADERMTFPLRVKPTGNDSLGGESWNSAMRTIPAALRALSGSGVIWAQAGTYDGNHRLRSGMTLYGGFAGTESDLSQRDWTNNVTVLDGGNSDSVITINANADASTRVDGFTIRNGIKNGIRCFGGSPIIANNIIRDNNGDPHGGGVRIEGNAIIESNIIRNNVALSLGGGVYIEGEDSQPMIRDNIIELNEAAYGGAIMSNKASPTIRDNSIWLNSASGFGGAIYVKSAITAVVEGGVISQNVSSGNGGAIYADESNINILNVKIHNNDAALKGGGIYLQGGHSNIMRCQIGYNKATDGAGVSMGQRMGFNQSTIVDSCVIESNNAVRNGGGIEVLPHNDANIVNNSIVWNSPSGIDLYPLPEDNVRISNTIIAFNDNGARRLGNAGAPDFRNNCVYNPRGLNFAGLPNPTGTYGNISADPLFVAPEIGDWHISSESPCFRAGNPTLIASVIDIDGQARSIGGADASDIGADFVKVAFVSSLGDDDNIGDSWTQAKRNIQTGINAVTPYGEVWTRMGVYTENIELKKTARAFGGFVGNETSLSQRNWGERKTVIDGGGAGSVVTVAPGAIMTTRLDGFTIRNGSAANGAGVLCDGVSPTIIHCVITNNSASETGFGGGILCVNNAAPIIANNVITGNAAGFGGGVRSSNSEPSLINNTIAENATTIESNGGGVSLFDSSGIIVNNIIAFNSSGVSNAGTGATIFRHNNAFENAAFDYNGVSPTPGLSSGSISVDPLFVDQASGDWHLLADSQCRNRGDNFYVGTDWRDMDAQPRIMGGRVDMGADETSLIYVKKTGNDDNDGSSWEMAKLTIQAGVDAATPAGEVWVAAGTYVENVLLKRGAALYGGFSGSEARLIDRNWILNPVIIDGNASGAVVETQPGAGKSTRLDGFTITNGQAQNGGGLYIWRGSPTIIHNVITGNDAVNGGGIYVYDDAAPDILNNVITGNTAANGGGVYVFDQSPLIANNVITANTASEYGGGFYCILSGGSSNLINNTIAANIAESAGGGVAIIGSEPKLANNIVAFNSSGVFNSGAGAPTLIKNCVHNPSGANYTGLTPGSTDITSDPLFVNKDAADWHLTSASPCLNAADNAEADANWVDMDGEPRIMGGTADIGADERPIIIHVAKTGNNSNNGESWAQAKLTVQEGINAAQDGGQVWVATGNYVENITVPAGAVLYGGFNGSETEFSQRNFQTNIAILNGGGGGSAVTVAQGANERTRIDGFMITGGTGTGANAHGGGIYLINASPTIINNQILNNSGGEGGGIYGSETRATILNNAFISNAASLGGGISLTISNPLIANNVFVSNSSSGNGGGISLFQSHPLISGNTFINNAATDNGGGIYGILSQPHIANTIIAFNSSGIYTTDYSAFIRHSCFYNPDGDEFGDVQPQLAAGNLFTDPLLVNAAVGNYRITTASPCRDAGYNDDARGDKDMDGQPRILAGIVDIGADERALIHIMPDGDDALEGSTWASAKASAQAGVNAAAPFGEVWVAVKEGGYVENISVPSGVSIYGGFNGGEQTLRQRNLKTNATILDGNASGSVVSFAPFVSSDTRLDGFTITNGKAQKGGGVYIASGSPVIANNVIRANLSYHSDSAGGGGVYVAGGAPQICNNLITQNITESGGDAYGGGVYIGGGATVFINNTTVSNEATGVGAGGGGIFISGASPIVANSIIAFNSPGILKSGIGGSPALSNNCVFGNKGYDYQDIAAGDGDININPLFVNPDEGDFRINADSPCVDAGDNDKIPAAVQIDLDGAPRISDGNEDGSAIIDMGAYEFQSVRYITSGMILEHLLGRETLPSEKLPYSDINDDGVIDAADLILLIIEDL